MNTRQKLTLGIAAIFMVTLTIVGVTYAYFVTRVTGETEESVEVTTATLGNLEYGDGSGIASLTNALPGTTVYKSFSVTNKSANPQAFTITLEDVGAEASAYTTTIDGEEVKYAYGEFIHGNNGSNEGSGIATCYADNAKRSTEEGADTTNCFVANNLYNNMVVSLYQLDNNVLVKDTNGNPILDKDGKASIDGTSVLTGYTLANAERDGDDKLVDSQLLKHASKVNVPVDENTSVTIPGATVYNYVLKIEYLNQGLNQNAENLAALSVKVDITN